MRYPPRSEEARITVRVMGQDAEAEVRRCLLVCAEYVSEGLYDHGDDLPPEAEDLYQVEVADLTGVLARPLSFPRLLPAAPAPTPLALLNFSEHEIDTLPEELPVETFVRALARQLMAEPPRDWDDLCRAAQHWDFATLCDPGWDDEADA